MDKSETLEIGLKQIGIVYTQVQLELLELYISEIELWNKKYKLVGAGGAEGAIDASNMLKPALARARLASEVFRALR